MLISDLNQKTINKLQTSQFYNKKKNEDIKALLEDVDRNKGLKNQELQSLDKKKKYQERLLSQLKQEQVSIKQEIQKQTHMKNTKHAVIVCESSQGRCQKSL